MRALSLALLLSAAAVASTHAQDRYSARGIVVVRDAPAASAPVSASVAPASLQSAPVQDQPAAERPMAAPLHYLSWPGKGQTRSGPMQTIVRSSSAEAAQARFTPAAAAPAPAPRQAQPAVAAYTPPPVVYAAPQPRPVAQQSIYDGAPTPAPQAFAAPARVATPAAMRTASYPPASPMTYTRTAPPRMPDAGPIEAESAEPAAKPVRSAKARPVKVTTPSSISSASAEAPPRSRIAKAPAREVAPVKSAAHGDVLVPVATAEGAPAPAAAAGRTPPTRMVPTSQQSGSGSTHPSGSTARFYSVGRQYGETPDPIVMPKQFFLDGSPDMAAPPPLPIPRIAPSAGKSTAVQRAAAENSQTDPDAPVN